MNQSAEDDQFAKEHKTVTERREHSINDSILMDESALSIKLLSEKLGIEPPLSTLKEDPHFWFLASMFYEIRKKKVDEVFAELMLNPLLELKLIDVLELRKIELALHGAFDLITAGEMNALTESWNIKSLETRIVFLQDLLKENGLEREYQIIFYYIDLDDFKPVNDTFGHKVGDVVLKEFVKAAQALTRAEDSVFRLGGEEFGILLLVDLDNLKTQAKKRGVNYQQLIEEQADNFRIKVIERTLAGIQTGLNEIEHLSPAKAEQIGQLIKVGLSIGITRVEAETSPLSVISAGDELMYKAKQAGKNRVVSQWTKDEELPKPAFLKEMMKRIQFLFTGKK